MIKMHILMIKLHLKKLISYLSDLDCLVNFQLFYINNSTKQYTFLTVKTQKPLYI